jgi:hypothetical protein
VRAPSKRAPRDTTAIKLPARNFFTWDELKARWECTDNDLITAVIRAVVKPCIRVHTDLRLLVWRENDLTGEMMESWYIGPGGLPAHFHLFSWLYLQDPIQTHPFNCEFSRVNCERDAEKDHIVSCSEELKPLIKQVHYAVRLKLPEPLRIEDVKNDAVFLHREVTAYEALHGADAVVAKVDQPLATRERNTMLSMIAVLCKEAKLDYKTPAKTAGRIRAAAEIMGIGIGETTIEGHLKKIPDGPETRMK